MKAASCDVSKCPFRDVHLQAIWLLDLAYHLPINHRALPAVMSDPGLRPFFQDIALTKLKNKLVSFLAFAFAPSSESWLGCDMPASLSEPACRSLAMRLCAGKHSHLTTPSITQFRLPECKHEPHACLYRHSMLALHLAGATASALLRS